MAATTMAATLTTATNELRPALMERILVIEHDVALGLRRLLGSEGYEVKVVPNGVAGLESLLQRVPAAVVLDLPPGIFRV
jgi:CheY-like chemotaxis protein